MLPSGWTYAPISAFKHPTDQTVQTGPFGAQLHSADYVDEGVPFILIRNMVQGGVDESGMPRILPKDAERLSNYKLKLNDIVFSRVGRVGSCFLAGQDQVGWVISGQLLRLRLNLTALDSHFLLHWIRSSFIERHIGNESVGSTRQSINSAILGNMPVPDVPFQEQVKIAEILDILDTAIHETEAIMAKLKAVKHGLLHDLLTRGIDANGELRPPLADGPHLYKESPLGWIPKEWESLPLEQVTDTPICYGIVQVFGFVPNGVPVLAIRDLHGDYATGIHRTALRIDAAYPRSRVRPGDVLLSIKGTLGRVGVVPSHFTGNISRDIALIRPTPRVRSKYLAQMLQSTIGQRLLSLAQVGTTRGEISIAPLRRIVVPLPDIEEQQRLEASFEATEERIKQEELNLQKLRSEKVGLMDDLLTGRVRVAPLLAEAAQQQVTA